MVLVGLGNALRDSEASRSAALLSISLSSISLTSSSPLSKASIFTKSVFNGTAGSGVSSKLSESEFLAATGDSVVGLVTGNEVEGGFEERAEFSSSTPTLSEPDLCNEDAGSVDSEGDVIGLFSIINGAGIDVVAAASVTGADVGLASTESEIVDVLALRRSLLLGRFEGCQWPSLEPLIAKCCVNRGEATLVLVEQWRGH